MQLQIADTNADPAAEYDIRGRGRGPMPKPIPRPIPRPLPIPISESEIEGRASLFAKHRRRGFGFTAPLVRQPTLRAASWG